MATEEDFSDSSRYPQAGSRPVTSRPMRPVTSLTSRPGTAAVLPDWMFSEDQAGAPDLPDRPKTGYVKVRLNTVLGCYEGLQ